MAIKGLTDQISKAKAQTDARGRIPRIGILGKGVRETDNKGVVRLHDLDHFIFKPTVAGKEAALVAAFNQAYGKQPEVIPDVRFTASLAGNFEIEDQAWLVASKHTKHGSLFLARSDGEWISQMRDENGRMQSYQPGDLAYQEVTAPHPKSKKDALKYRDHLYEWGHTMKLDLILPALNELLYAQGLAGFGVVTFITQSKNDIANLIAEYHGVLEELAGLYADPTKPGSLDLQKRYIPLREIPMMLGRVKAVKSTPGWGDDTADRRFREFSLCHLQLNPEIAAAMHKAREARRDALLVHIASGGQLQHALGSGRGQQDDQKLLQDVNEDLFGPSPATTRKPEATAVSPEVQAYNEAADADWEELITHHQGAEEGEAEAGAVGVDEDPIPWEKAEPQAEEEVPPSDYDWEAYAKEEASTLDAFAQAVFKHGQNSLFFEDVNEARRGVQYICGKAFAKKRRAIMWEAMAKYVAAVADGAKRVAAAETAQKWYNANR